MLDAALTLTDAFWTTADDQSVYATYFLSQQVPLIKLDYCQDIFAALSGTPQTAKFTTLSVSSKGMITHQLTHSQPIVAHMPGRSKRFDDFLKYMLIKK